MGLTYADIKLTNRFTGQHLITRALVDTGAVHLCIPPALAVQLGFDVDEFPTRNATVADGRQLRVPKVDPIRIDFANRDCVTEALVLGDQTLLGVVPLELMDLVVDPIRQEIRVNPDHPNYPVFPVK